MLNPKSVANFFIEVARSSGEHLNPMKLQKLVYYAHGWYAGYTGQPLINETVEAWPYGPVIPSLYHEFKRFGSGNINSKAMDFVNGQYCEVPPPYDPSIQTFLNNIWASYGKYTGIALSEMTHSADSPWDITRRNNMGIRGADIPLPLMQNHFRALIERAQQKAVQ